MQQEKEELGRQLAEELQTIKQGTLKVHGEAQKKVEDLELRAGAKVQ